MKWKYVIILVALAAACLSVFVLYYGFDWRDLVLLSFYEDLANPSIRIVKVEEGLRKEQVVAVVGAELGWDENQKTQFENAHLALNDTSMEGYYFPKTYMVSKDENPAAMTQMMFAETNKEVQTVSKSKSAKIVNEDTALKIASIIQRESGGKSDMRLISGIIWNRLFAGMKLQMDATLQYVKGNSSNWWPEINSADKKIDSLYNTYIYFSLPPTPIANPGLAAISAAYNPQKTSCLFYLHDKNGLIHCSATYEGHLTNIAKYY